MDWEGEATPSAPSSSKGAEPQADATPSAPSSSKGAEPQTEEVEVVLTLGICTMDNKAQSVGMKELVSRLCNPKDFPLEIKPVYFGDEMILNVPIEEWPICDALICFHTHHFPLEKALAYIQLRQPHCVNDVSVQKDLLDRRYVYRRLQEHNIPVPNYLVIDYSQNPEVICDDEHLVFEGKTLLKPILEKPVSSEDHDIRIYYPEKEPYSGGVTRLFRKHEIVGVMRSSVHISGTAELRKNGCFIYEEFLPTGGVDLKAYSVGPNYVHVEARKAPGVDGFVDVDPHTFKEVRYPIILSAREKAIIAKTVQVLRQTVCGIDLLRTPDNSYVVDVNGWSFVKGSMKYYDDAAWLLRRFFYEDLFGVNGLVQLPSAIDNRSARGNRPSPKRTATNERIWNRNGDELRAVIGFFRHGDITVRDKLKTVVTASALLALIPNGDRTVAFRSKAGLRKVLDVCNGLQAAYDRDGGDVGIDPRHLMKMVKVLRSPWNLKTGHRKVRLRWTNDADDGTGRGEGNSSGGASDVPSGSAFLVIKWGGELTKEGYAQTVNMGQRFRSTMYSDCDGLLRLHATYRHDLKIFCSEESREIATGAAFAQGLLSLRGSLAQIAATCVECNNSVFLEDDNDKLQRYLVGIRHKLEHYVNSRSSDIDFFGSSAVSRAACQRLVSRFGSLYAAIERLRAQMLTVVDGVGPSEEEEQMGRRWLAWVNAFYNDRWVLISKVVGFWWNVQHALKHERELLKMCLGEDGLKEFEEILEDVARCLIPQEFGVAEGEKLHVAQLLGKKMLDRLRLGFIHGCRDGGDGGDEDDGDNCGFMDSPRYTLDAEKCEIDDTRHVRTRLYFTRKSYLLALLHMLVNMPQLPVESKLLLEANAHKLCYLAHIAFVLFEVGSPVDRGKAAVGSMTEKNSAFEVHILFSSGGQAATIAILPLGDVVKWLLLQASCTT